jgi:hypothetical protein
MSESDVIRWAPDQYCDPAPGASVYDGLKDWLEMLPEKGGSGESVARALVQLQRPLITSWPAFTAAMHILRRERGWPRSAASPASSPWTTTSSSTG